MTNGGATLGSIVGRAALTRGVVYIALLVAAKVVAIAAVASTVVGRAKIAEELPSGLVSWFAEDVFVGVVLGGLIGGFGGFLRAQIGKRVEAAFVGVFGVIVAVATALAIMTYVHFGVPLSSSLLRQVGRGTDVVDSVLALAWHPLTLLGPVFVVWIVLGPRLVRWRIESVRPAIWVALSVAVVGLMTTAFVLVPAKSPLHLDQNWLVAILRSDSAEPEHWATKTTETRFDIVLRSDRAGDVTAPATAYQRLRQWAEITKPNVILVILETMAIRHLQLMGGKINNTPTLARLAARSVLWPRHYAHVPLSMPAIYNILCGSYSAPWQAPITQRNPRVNCRSLPEVLVSHGYHAGLWHSGRFSYYDKDRFLRGRGYSVFHDATTMPNRDHYHEGSWGIEEVASIDALLAWLSVPGRQPRFATYIPVYPHHPYQLPPGGVPLTRGGSDIARYRNAAYYVDQSIKHLVDGLGSSGQLGKTLLVFVGDHGEGFGEHPGSYMHGTKLYEEAVRTFAMWYAPFALSSPVVDSRSFGHVDIVPTLIDMLGISSQSIYPGMSAMAPGDRPMIPLFTAKPHQLIGLVDGNWKYIYDHRTKSKQLFDLDKDPGETHSIVAEFPARVEWYQDRLRKFSGVQAAWEQSLGRLSPRTSTQSQGRQPRRWIIRPVDCSYQKDEFRRSGSVFVPTQTGLSLIRCRGAVPADWTGNVSRLIVNGNESIAGAWIGVTVQEIAADGARRQIAGCQLNQTTQCQAVANMADVATVNGATLEIEIRHIIFHRPVSTAKDHQVTSVVLEY